jgi:hypothetical protein
MQVTAAPAAPVQAAPVQAAPVAEAPAPAPEAKVVRPAVPAAQSVQLYNKATSPQEVKSVINRWVVEVCGATVPQQVKNAVPSIQAGLEGQPILINGEENAQIRDWVKSCVAAAMQPAADLI